MPSECEKVALQDIDLVNNYKKCSEQLQEPESKNFAVLFGVEQAKCAVNLCTDALSNIVQVRSREQGNRSCLWLNLWGWDPEHEKMVRTLAGQYEVSPRLTHLLCPKANGHSNVRKRETTVDKVTSVGDVDSPERKRMPDLSGTVLRDFVQPKRSMPTGIADIANDLWHFCTVDFGRRYVCICWNALFFLPGDGGQPYAGRPHAIRVWSSLLLCDDGTVISTFESPTGLDDKQVAMIRHNQLNVFTHLSKFGAVYSNENALMQIAIRPFHSPESFTEGSEMAHLLFYYLFDDWVNIYYQAVGAENSYRNQLETLRQKMIDSAEVEQVTTLHRIGRELSVLRAVYRSYESIIERIVQKHRRSNAQANIQYQIGSDLPRARSFRDATPDNMNGATKSDMLLGTSTIARFERLRDRISLCAVTEVDECLKEKDDLVVMVSLVPLRFSSQGEIHKYPKNFFDVYYWCDPAPTA